MKRVLSILSACGMLLLLSGCPAPRVAPSVLPTAPKESIAPPAALPNDAFFGVWRTEDEQGQAFDLLLFPNGQVVSTWTKGTSGAHGERGFWRAQEVGALVFAASGKSYRLAATNAGFECAHFPIGVGISPAAPHASPAEHIVGELAVFVGIWKLNKEPDGSFLYITLQSSGRAYSTIAGGTEGKWEVTKEGALIQWPDGWSDLIFSASDGFQKRSWVGTIEQNATPPDISPATRVGDLRFDVSP